jgi:hypothetical protein
LYPPEHDWSIFPSASKEQDAQAFRYDSEAQPAADTVNTNASKIRMNIAFMPGLSGGVN